MKKSGEGIALLKWGFSHKSAKFPTTASKPLLRVHLNSGEIRGTPYLIIDNNDYISLAFRMARIARVVAPGIPHHVTQRGNRRQQTFFHDEDYQAYLELTPERCAKYKVQIWAYCLMPNHVHLIAVPETKDSLNLASLTLLKQIADKSTT